jgi:hypothetical protein
MMLGTGVSFTCADAAKEMIMNNKHAKWLLYFFIAAIPF